MSDEQPTSWRDRFFGSSPSTDADAASRDGNVDEPALADDAPVHDESAATPAEADAAATSIEDHDEPQPLVEHTSRDDDDRGGDSPIEPTVIAPSTLRGPSHSAAHPDDSARATADEVHDEAAENSLEQHRGQAAASDADGSASGAATPPPLVEPRRPSFGLRRRTDADDAAADADALAGGADARPGTSDRDFVEPAPTEAMAQQPDHHADDEQRTRAMHAKRTPEVEDTAAQTQVLDTQDDYRPGDTTQRTERFGIVRDEVPPSTIAVDEETARAAAGGTPIVLVEEPQPPRRKGARGVGFLVALLASIIFAALFAVAFFAVGYLFDRAFNATETLETVWLRPSYLLPVVVFFLAYWLITLLVNRAGWWAHVLGAFVVALLVYAAHIAGAHIEQEGGWSAYASVFSMDLQSLGQLVLAPLSVLAFILAREVPIWFGGIVARRGRKARDWNRQALDDFNAENAERLAAYERARG
ncbi:hypothetical protein [Agrococcus sp. ProA11]|uniref:hypothetical protein n=1 Tax=Agrococcus chionoecetis TaxID=3153752 RepID=UPI003260B3FD